MKSKPAVSLADHKRMTALGIAFRESDGKWGYKRKCANQACDKIIDWACYCSESLERAFVEVELRAGYCCSTRCAVIVNGSNGLHDSFVDHGYDWLSQHVGDAYSKKRHKTIGAALLAGDPDRLKPEDRKILFDWAEEEMNEWDGEDEDACSCEI